MNEIQGKDITPEDSVVPTYLVPLTAGEIAAEKAWQAGEYQRQYDAISQARKLGYQNTADPIFFQWQRGESTEQEWLDAVRAVNNANPYPPIPKK